MPLVKKDIGSIACIQAPCGDGPISYRITLAEELFNIPLACAGSTFECGSRPKKVKGFERYNLDRYE